MFAQKALSINSFTRPLKNYFLGLANMELLHTQRWPPTCSDPPASASWVGHQAIRLVFYNFVRCSPREVWAALEGHLRKAIVYSLLGNSSCEEVSWAQSLRIPAQPPILPRHPPRTPVSIFVVLGRCRKLGVNEWLGLQRNHHEWYLLVYMGETTFVGVGLNLSRKYTKTIHKAGNQLPNRGTARLSELFHTLNHRADSQLPCLVSKSLPTKASFLPCTNLELRTPQGLSSYVEHHKAGPDLLQLQMQMSSQNSTRFN